MGRRGVLLGLGIVLCVCADAYSTEQAGSFLRLGADPRAIAVGGAFCAVADGATSFAYNPAGLADLPGRQAFAMYGPCYGFSRSEGYYHVLAYAQSIGQRVALGAGWIRLGVDDIPEYPALEQTHVVDRQHEAAQGPIGYFSDREDAFFFSFAKSSSFTLDLKWRSFIVVRLEAPIGLSLKFIRCRLGGNAAQGLGIDGGVMLRFSASDLFGQKRLGCLAFGLAWHDASHTDLDWDTGHRDRIRQHISSAVSYTQDLPSRQMEVGLCVQADGRDHGHSRVGMQWGWKQRLFLRLGYDGETATCGLGLSLGSARLDYALVPHELGANHRVGAALRL